MYKSEIRTVGIDDSPFKKSKRGNILVVGTIFRGGALLDGLLATKVSIDGNNATKKLIEMINKSKFRVQLRCILLNGIAVAGFNVIDIKELNRKTSIPVIVVVRKYPDFKKIEQTMEKIGQHKKYSLIEKAGPVERLSFHNHPACGRANLEKMRGRADHFNKINQIYIQRKGITLKKAEEILKLTCTRSLIPEPIRVAHLIAGGIVTGESKGKA